MVWSSVRVRLTLWNMCILAMVLGAFGTAMSYTVQANQARAIDSDLARRARPVKNGRWPGPRRVFGWRQRVGEGAPPPGLMLHLPELPPGANLQLRDGQLLEERTPSHSNSQEPDFARPVMFDLEGNPRGPEADLPWDRSSFQYSAGGGERYSTVMFGGERLRVLSLPMRQDGILDGVIQFAHPLGEQQRLADSLAHTLFATIPAALLVAGLGGLLITSHALRPVRKVTQAAAQIGAEDLSRRLEVSGRDELAELASTFNGMIARLEAAFLGMSDAYRQLETAYQEQRRFTADASHELRTPLTRIKGMTSLALCGPHCAEEYREALEVADAAADTMGRIVQDLLLLARADAGELRLQPKMLSVSKLLSGAVERVASLSQTPVRLQPVSAELTVDGDQDHLERLLVNLLENALRHTPPQGVVTLSAEQIDSDVQFVVSDTGEGIAPEHLPHLCERFYRVDAARARADGGTGLGLAICRSIAQAHGGHLEIHSTLGEGTQVVVRLPQRQLPGESKEILKDL